jgi:hypothetical protein
VIALIAVGLLCTSGNGAVSPVAAGATQTLTVDANNVVSVITNPYWGVNYPAYWDGNEGSSGSRQALRNAGIQLIRFPGGVPADWYDWADPLRDNWTRTSTAGVPAQAGSVNLRDYANGAGAQLLLQTNPTTNHNNDPSGAHAAGWVNHADEHDVPVAIWEVGNEPDNVSGMVDFDWDRMQWYYDRFGEHAAAMKAADPSIRVVGPAGTNSYFWWQLHTLEMFLVKHGDKAGPRGGPGTGLTDGVSLHYYPEGGCGLWSSIKQAGQNWPGNMNYIKSAIATYDSRPLPVFITETNAAISAQNCGIADELSNALANADLFGAFRETGVQSVVAFGEIHHATAGWGLLTDGDVAVPYYYIFPIWSRTGDRVLAVSGETDAANVLSAYASKDAQGDVQVVAINKDAAPTTVSLALNGYNPAGGTVQIYELRGQTNAITDTGIFYNGVLNPSATAAEGLPAPETASVPGATYSRTLPPYSMTLFAFTAPTSDAATATPVLPATPVSTATPVNTPTPVRTATPTRTATPVRTATPTRTATPVRTASPTAAAATATRTPGGSPSATPQAGFVSAASPSPKTVSPGKAVQLGVSVRSPTAGRWLIDLEVYNARGERVYQRAYDDQAFSANQQRSYSPTWTLPAGAATGTYTIKVGIFSPGWGTVYAWNDNAGQFTVVP